MGNSMKGFVFTLDAVFALIIAIMAISILLYIQFYSQTPYQIHSSESSALLQSMLSTNISAISQSDYIASGIEQQTLSQNVTWDTYEGDPANIRDKSSMGPIDPFVSYIITSKMPINAPQGHAAVFSDYGKIFYAAGSNVIAANEQTGTTEWAINLGAGANPSVLGLYHGMLFFNNSNTITAVNAYTGNTLWYSNLINNIDLPFQMPTIYSGDIFIGGGIGGINKIDASNGTFITSYTGAGSCEPLGTAEALGNIAFADSASCGSELGLVAYHKSAVGKLWSNSISMTTNVGSFNNVLHYGYTSSGSYYAGGTYINGSQAFTPVASQTEVLGTAIYINSSSGQNNKYVFQSSNSVFTLHGYGNPTQVWSYAVPSSFGSDAANVLSPVIGGNTIYTLWQNGVVLAQDTHNGNVRWSTQLPYPGPYYGLSLAYGKLFVISKYNIIAFGSCHASAESSIAHAAAQMYANGQGSCANYLLSRVSPMINYTVTLDGKYAAYRNIATFNSVNSSAIIASAPGLNHTSGGYNTVSFWMYWNGSVQDYADGLTIGTGSGSLTYGVVPFSFNTFDIHIGYGSTCLGFNTGNSDVYGFLENSLANKWVNIIAEFYNGAYTGNSFIFLDGANQTLSQCTGNAQSKTVIGDNFSIGGMNLGSAQATQYYFPGSIANLQIYNTQLDQQQVSQLYTGGITSPPLQNAGLVAWYPLDGDANDYGGGFNTGYPENVIFNGGINYTPVGLANAGEVSASSTVVSAYNYTTGRYGVYNFSVISWG